MKAMVLNAYGGSENLTYQEVPEPAVAPNEVKVRMVGAGINPIDWKLRNGALQTVMPLTFPAILGRDASGIVVEVGVEVRRIEVGARVMGLVWGAYADFVVANLEAWAEVPAELDLVDAAALPLALLTGAQLIEQATRPKPGDVVLVTGALGSVGRTAVYVAKTCGAKVLAGVRAAQKVQAAALGADGVVALDDDGELAGLPLLDAVADTVGGSTIAKLLERLIPGGTIGSIVGEPIGAQERGFMVRNMLTHADAQRLAALALVVAEGKLLIPIVKRLALHDAAEAQGIAEHHAGGKVILLGSRPVPATRREPLLHSLR